MHDIGGRHHPRAALLISLRVAVQQKDQHRVAQRSVRLVPGFKVPLSL